MKHALAALAVCLASSAYADSIVFSAGSTTVRLAESPCPSETLKGVLASNSPMPALVAEITHGGRNIAACWAFAPDGVSVLIVDAEGDGGAIPAAAFKRVPGA